MIDDYFIIITRSLVGAAAAARGFFTPSLLFACFVFLVCRCCLLVRLPIMDPQVAGPRQPAGTLKAPWGVEWASGHSFDTCHHLSGRKWVVHVARESSRHRSACGTLFGPDCPCICTYIYMPTDTHVHLVGRKGWAAAAAAAWRCWADTIP